MVQGILYGSILYKREGYTRILKTILKLKLCFGSCFSLVDIFLHVFYSSDVLVRFSVAFWYHVWNFILPCSGIHPP